MLNLCPKRLKPALLNARRSIEDLEGVEILEDVQWDPTNKNWVLLCCLSPMLKSNGLIPISTNWYVKIDDSYPWGKIKFVPAKIGGLLGTFPHQNYNGDVEEMFPWRDGDLCLNTSSKVFQALGFDSEPFDAASRLIWHFKRALLWLQAANDEELIKFGEPFELPHFPKAASKTIAFSESGESYINWRKSNKKYGLIEFKKVLAKELDLYVTTKFTSMDNKVIYEPLWGEAINQSSTYSSGMWIMLNEVPVLDPWQAPTSWGELEIVCKEQGIDLIKIMRAMAPKFRNGNPHIVLLGFPIPAKFGEEPIQIFWQPIQLPALSYGIKKIKGFRKLETWHWYRDRQYVFGANKPIYWLMSENWNENELYNRGKLHSNVTSSAILQIGAGAVGSTIAELLVRTGQNKLTIVDDDLLLAGNLVRHTLNIGDIYKPKAEALAKKLNQTSPHVIVKGIKTEFPQYDSKVLDLDEFNAIIDCTGEDEVLHHLAHMEGEKERKFISISLGYGAKRLFVFLANKKRFPHHAFMSLIQPWLMKEQVETADIEFPREGIGCWHPVFPARAEDVWLLTSAAFKYIESSIITPYERPTLIVFEQKWNDECFEGISLVSKEEYSE
ncbi:ThiF family adenylyltransferase [Bacillus sp. FSL K6-0277]|uniref:ThiF family adenylyltransferase n=1 Tax=Bacillus sp. FSL K6-0277 TaxID=2921451 RepID=UPI0030F93A88